MFSSFACYRSLVLVIGMKASRMILMTTSVEIADVFSAFFFFSSFECLALVAVEFARIFRKMKLCLAGAHGCERMRANDGPACI